MKTLSILTAALLAASIQIPAHADQSSNIYVANASDQVEVENNATKLKFTSRRPQLNPAVKNKKYEADDAWQGATDVEENASNASKRMNRQFRSRRPYIDYQFD